MQHRAIKPDYLWLFIGKLRQPINFLYVLAFALFTAFAQGFFQISFFINSVMFVVEFWPLAVITCGLLFGPASGLLCGALGQVLATLVLGAAPYYWLYTVTAALTGVIAPIFLMRFSRRSVPSYLYMLLAVSSAMLFHLLADTAAASLSLGIPYFSLLWPHAIAVVILTPIFAYAAHWAYQTYDLIINPLDE